MLNTVLSILFTALVGTFSILAFIMANNKDK